MIVFNIARSVLAICGFAFAFAIALMLISRLIHRFDEPKGDDE